MALASGEAVVVPPNNVEVEIQLLGAILANNAAYHRISELTRPEHFYVGVHGRIFAALATLCDRGEIASGPTLWRQFDGDADLREAGGAGYLAKLLVSNATIMDVAQHAEILRDLWVRRRLVDSAADLTIAATAKGIDRDAIGVAQQHLEQVYQLIDDGSGQEGGAVSIGEAAHGAAAQAERAWKNRGRLLGLPTGISGLDKLLGGLMPGHLVVIGGRPSMGKTALATGCAAAAAKHLAWEAHREQRRAPLVLEFHLEMSKTEIMMRRLAAETSIGLTDMRDGRVDAGALAGVAEAATKLGRLPVELDDTPRLTIGDIRSRSRRAARRGAGIAMIVVDHMGLVEGSKDARRHGETAILSETSGGLKSLAKELNCPVLALSQLSRDLERREDKRPMLADLRNSGSIEQDADIVLFVYRPEYYLNRDRVERRPNEGEESWAKRHAAHSEALERARGKAEIIVAKHRMGPLRTIECRFDGPRTAFSDTDQADMPL